MLAPLLALAVACGGSSGEDLFIAPGGGDGGVVQLDAAATEPACRPGEKTCNGGCVRTDDPAFGCASAGCEPCSVSHGTAACDAAGKCAVGQCEPGRANCSGSSTGCDAKLASDPENCGACGKKCAANQVCGPEGCSSGCASGLIRCDRSCVDVSFDESNCGACGKVCPAPANGFATCSAKQCGIRCNAGYHSCNGTTCVAEGPSSCGATCKVCPGPLSGHGAATCNAGSCGVACDPGYAPCASGCCAVTPTCGPSNCGGCCSNGTCLAGTSQSACGTGGGACAACNAGSSCNAGVCAPIVVQDGGGGPACDPNDQTLIFKVLTELQKPNPRYCNTGCGPLQCCFTGYNVCVDLL